MCGGGQRGLRSPARGAGGRAGSLTLLLQPIGLPACSEAAASAACARKPHCPPGVAGWMVMGNAGSDALLSPRGSSVSRECRDFGHRDFRSA
jgi:hypothetical protein